MADGPGNLSFMPIEKLGVASWRDGPVGSDAPVDAVVLHFSMEAVKLGMGLLESIQENKPVTFGLRMKSREKVDAVIALLEKYRDEVWEEEARHG